MHCLYLALYQPEGKHWDRSYLYTVKKRGGWNNFIFVHCSIVGKVGVIAEAVAVVVVAVVVGGGGQFIFVSRLSGSVRLLRGILVG